MRYRLCIFDLDGTLADTVASIAYSANLTLEKLGYPKQPVDKFRYFAGDGVEELTRRCLAEAGDVQGEHYEEFLEIYRKQLSDHCMHQVKPFEGICGLLEALGQKGVMRAVLSNKPHRQAVEVIKSLFGDKTFEFVLGQQEGIPRKPNPTGALQLAGMAEVSPEECLYIGDTNTDMQTGSSAGMHTVGVLWGFRTREELEENGAGHIVERPEEILDILEETDL